MKSRRRFGDELAVLVEIFDALGDDGDPDPIDIDLARRLPRPALIVMSGGSPSTITSSSPGVGGMGLRSHRRGGTSSGGVIGSFSPGS